MRSNLRRLYSSFITLGLGIFGFVHFVAYGMARGVPESLVYETPVYLHENGVMGFPILGESVCRRI